MCIQLIFRNNYIYSVARSLCCGYHIYYFAAFAAEISLRESCEKREITKRYLKKIVAWSIGRQQQQRYFYLPSYRSFFPDVIDVDTFLSLYGANVKEIERWRVITCCINLIHARICLCLSTYHGHHDIRCH